MRSLADALQVIAATLWVGGLWVIGYLVAPVLFARLDDRALAGTIAGELFTLMAWVGLACGAYLLLFRLVRYGFRMFRQGVFWVLILMLALVALGQYGVHPVLEALKAEALPKQVMESLMRDRFVAWHGVSSALYVVVSVLGAALTILLGKGR